MFFFSNDTFQTRIQLLGSFWKHTQVVAILTEWNKKTPVILHDNHL